MRLGHPFPSLLAATATLLIASLAGAGPLVALRLAASMLALQASIGALNDLVDAGIDSGRKPGKPIPRGAAPLGAATALAAVGLVAGLALSAPSGAGTVAVAAIGVGCGYLYDLRLSRTAWSWLPFAVALPLLPAHAWLGATGGLPPTLVDLVPVGLLAGAGLALGNGLADIERDRDAGLGGAAVRAGPGRAWWLHAVALLGAAAAALVVGPGRPEPWWLVARLGGTIVIVLGTVLVRDRGPAIRERGWELEAIGVAILGIAWLAGVAAR